MNACSPENSTTSHQLVSMITSESAIAKYSVHITTETTQKASVAEDSNEIRQEETILPQSSTSTAFFISSAMLLSTSYFTSSIISPLDQISTTTSIAESTVNAITIEAQSEETTLTQLESNIGFFMSSAMLLSTSYLISSTISLPKQMPIEMQIDESTSTPAPTQVQQETTLTQSTTTAILIASSAMLSSTSYNAIATDLSLDQTKSLQPNQIYQFMVTLINRQDSSRQYNGYLFVKVEKTNVPMVVVA
ncbi:unnamed protein product [Rotaria sordida]|uniref:REJ domain-containing protein n=2 Tax=Rotaria sordida TaxID=392033 RepID=A0A818SDC6_9BILA|nr:unnamed protein product [Rotaria sordida]CAF3902597.1 unnamed protein product [Rotaria sordida]